MNDLMKGKGIAMGHARIRLVATTSGARHPVKGSQSGGIAFTLTDDWRAG